MAERHTGTLKPPRVGDKWDRGEKRQDVRGKARRFVAVMGPTGLVLAWDVSTTKEGATRSSAGGPACGGQGAARIRNI